MSDYIKHPKCLLLVHEQEQHASPEIQALTVTNSRYVNRKCCQNSSKTLNYRRFNDLRVGLLVLCQLGAIGERVFLFWLEVDVVGMSAVEITFNEFRSLRVGWGALSNKFLIKAWIFVDVLLATSVEPPSVASPFWRDSFSNEPLDFLRPRWESDRNLIIQRGQSGLLEQTVPLFLSANKNLFVFSVPGVVFNGGNILSFRTEPVSITRCGWLHRRVSGRSVFWSGTINFVPVVGYLGLGWNRGFPLVGDCLPFVVLSIM